MENGENKRLYNDIRVVTCALGYREIRNAGVIST